MKKVVIVDDSRSVIASADLALEELQDSKKIVLISYTNPLDVVALIEGGNFDFDLMFCDVNMPQLVGYELVANVKAHEPTKQKPILMLTTESSDESKALGKRLGVTGWLTKPFSEKKIEMAVKKLLNI